MLWGFENRKFTCKDVYKFIKTYYAEWFPKLPKYKAFNKRFCYLSAAIKALANELLSELTSIDSDCIAHLIDSMPVIVAKQSRSSSAKVAAEICDKGYCDSKKMWFYVVKLHALGQRQYKTLPLPTCYWLHKFSFCQHSQKAILITFPLWCLKVFFFHVYSQGAHLTLTQVRHNCSVELQHMQT